MKITLVDTTANLYKQALVLRDAVLRVPLGLSISDEDLSDEVSQIHFVATEENKVVGTVSLIPNYEKEAGKLRQMATAEKVRGKGYGKELVASLEKYALENDMHEIVLHARHYAVAFYAKLGYSICSESFQEVGIEHFKMQKSLI